METWLDNQQMRISRMAAELCAASLGTQCTILDRAFRTIEVSFNDSEGRAGSICELVKAVPEGAAQCAVAQQNGARRAIQLGAAYFYACHAELVEGIVPVQVDGIIVAYVLIGPLFLAPTDVFLRNRIADRLSSFHISEKTVREEIELIPVVEAERLKRCLGLLYELLSVPVAGSERLSQEGDATEVGQEIPAALPGTGRSACHGKGATNSSAKQRFILAKTWLGNLAEMRQDIGEHVLQRAGWQSSADVARAAALETVSALWRTAMEKNGGSVRIDLQNLALSELSDAQTYDAILDWATAAVRRVGRNSAAVSRETRSTLKKVQAYTRRSLAKKLSSAKVAQAAGMTARELERMLQRHLGIGFRLFLTMERISLARRLLRESRLTATQIAAKTGFSDQSNFTKTFVKFEGITPIQYRMNSTRNATPLELQRDS